MPWLASSLRRLSTASASRLFSLPCRCRVSVSPPRVTTRLPCRSSMSPTAPSSPMTSCHSTLWLTGWAKILFRVSRWLLLRSGAAMESPPGSGSCECPQRSGAGTAAGRRSAGPGRQAVHAVPEDGQADQRIEHGEPRRPAGRGVDLGPVRAARIVDHRHLLPGAGDDPAAHAHHGLHILAVEGPEHEHRTVDPGGATVAVRFHMRAQVDHGAGHPLTSPGHGPVPADPGPPEHGDYQ